MPILNKLEYLDETKGQIKTALNTKFNSQIQDTDTFRSYVDKIKNIYNNWPKVTGTGENVILNNTKKGKMILDLGSNTWQENLPNEYTGLDYIESNGTQYIDTGIVPKITHKYIIKFNTDLSQINNQIYFGSRTTGAYNTSLNQIYMGSYDNQNTFYSYVGTTNVRDVINSNTVYEKELSANSGNFNNLATQPLYLFALNNKGTASGQIKTKLYYFKIYENSSLIRYFVPCYRNSDNEVGLYDLISGAFYENQGTGDFIAGNEIGNYPTPTNSRTIQVVKGTNTIIIANSDNTQQQIKTLTLPEGMEMCKIGNGKDKFIKQNLKWYKDKEIQTAILNGVGNYGITVEYDDYILFNYATGTAYRKKPGLYNILADKLAPLGNAKNSILGNSNAYGIQMGISKEYATDVASLKTWLADNPITVKYPLLNPMLEEITDPTLISELDAIYETLRSYDNTTIITQENEDLPFIISASALMKGGN